MPCPAEHGARPFRNGRRDGRPVAAVPAHLDRLRLALPEPEAPEVPDAPTRPRPRPADGCARDPYWAAAGKRWLARSVVLAVLIPRDSWPLGSPRAGARGSPSSRSALGRPVGRDRLAAASRTFGVVEPGFLSASTVAAAGRGCAGPQRRGHALPGGRGRRTAGGRWGCDRRGCGASRRPSVVRQQGRPRPRRARPRRRSARRRASRGPRPSRKLRTRPRGGYVPWPGPATVGGH